MFILSSKGRLLVADKPLVMGILNTTPDSFFSESRVEKEHIVERAGAMIVEGATILDIGGQSTRPGAVQVDAKTEAERVLPAIEAVRQAYPEIWISVDTYYASVAKEAIALGADMVNDVSAGDDDVEMLNVVVAARVPFIAMHKKGLPETMQTKPQYENVVHDIMAYFRQKSEQFQSLGIYDWVLDPGFGFGKTFDHNYQIMAQLKSFHLFNRPVLIGISRKGMIQKALGVDASEALNGTTALHMLALQQGANILRVHDVKEAVQCIALTERIQIARGL